MFGRFINQYWSRDYGNATLDWMVLTTGLALLSVAIAGSLASSDSDVAIQTETAVVSAFGA